MSQIIFKFISQIIFNYFQLFSIYFKFIFQIHISKSYFKIIFQNHISKSYFKLLSQIIVSNYCLKLLSQIIISNYCLKLFTNLCLKLFTISCLKSTSQIHVSNSYLKSIYNIISQMWFKLFTNLFII